MNSSLDLVKTKNQLSNDLQITNLMLKSFQSVIKSEKELNNNQNNLEQMLEKILKLEDDENLSEQFGILSKYQKSLNLIQNTYVSNLQNKLQTSLESINSEVKLVQQKTTEFEKQNIQKDKKAQELKKAIGDAKVGQQKKDQMNTEFYEWLEQHEKNEVRVLNRAKNYIVDRNAEFKFFIQHYINVQVAKHSHSLQLLTELSQEIADIK